MPRCAALPDNEADALLGRVDWAVGGAGLLSSRSMAWFSSDGFVFSNGEFGEFEPENFDYVRLLDFCVGGRWSASGYDGSSDDSGVRRNDTTHESGSHEFLECKTASTSGQTLEDWNEEEDWPLA